MGSRAGTGIDMNLDLVPQREPGMTAYEMMLSESQERMLLVADKGREEEVYSVFRKWGLDAVRIGVVTSDGLLRVHHLGQMVAEIPNAALADEAPKYNRPYTKPPRIAPLEAPPFKSEDLNADLLKLLTSGDICSKRWIYEQYDYQVRTNTLAGPGADAAVVRIKSTNTSVAMSLDGNGRYCALDPREGTKLMVAECCRNLSTAGALPIATTNNLNFGNPEKPEIMAQIVESIEGLAEACSFFEVPVTGGNVSLYNETLGTPIFPTPVVGIVGIMETAMPIGVDFKKAGQTVMLIGGLGSASAAEMGGTQYAKNVLSKMWGVPPKLDMAIEKRVQETIREVVRGGHVESAHDVGEGGLAVTIAESSFGHADVGADITFDSELASELLLFHEGPSRILVSTTEPDKIFSICAKNDVAVMTIGVTLEARVTIRNRGNILIDRDLRDLRDGWRNGLEHLLHQTLPQETVGV
jgi:phosphoribosylformylglycinamidine synthase